MLRLLFALVLCADVLLSDNFLVGDGRYRRTKSSPDTVMFTTSRILPLSSRNIIQTPYGLRLLIDDRLISGGADAIKSQGMYMNGSVTVIKTVKDRISFYRYATSDSNLYSDMAPDVYSLIRTAGNFYKITPMPSNISECFLVISRSFEVPRSVNSAFVLNLDEVPDKGTEGMLVECNK